MQAPQAIFSYPTWATATKDMVGTGMDSSRLWFTVAQGIVTEVYYPRIDIPQIRDLGFIVADDLGFWVELRRLGAEAENNVATVDKLNGRIILCAEQGPFAPSGSE